MRRRIFTAAAHISYFGEWNELLTGQLAEILGVKTKTPHELLEGLPVHAACLGSGRHIAAVLSQGIGKIGGGEILDQALFGEIVVEAAQILAS